jgi:hypothetical protein
VLTVRYLDEPGLQVRVDEDVVPIALEAVPVADHHVLHGPQALYDHLVDAVEQPDRRWRWREVVARSERGGGDERGGGEET